MSLYTDMVNEYCKISKKIDKATAVKRDIDKLKIIINRCNQYSADLIGSIEGNKWKALGELALYASIEVKEVIALNRSIREIERAIRIA